MGKSCDDVGDKRVGFVDTGTKDIGMREEMPMPRYCLLFCLLFSACEREFDCLRKLVSYLLPSIFGISRL